MRTQIIVLFFGVLFLSIISLRAQEELEIDGDAQIKGVLNINDEFEFPISDGSDGQVLKTNGLGVLNWMTPIIDDEDWTLSGGNIYRQFGRVGIGTLTPDESLDVHGDVELEGSNRFINFKSTGILSHGLRFYDSGNFQGAMFYNPSEKYFNFTNDFNEVGLAISLSSNDVGIGTVSPSDQLHIKAPTNCDVRLEADGAKYLRFYEGNSQKGAIGHNGIDLLLQNFETNGDMSFNVDGGGVDMILETGGNVGIGTLDPQYKLDVNNGDAPSIATDAAIDLNVEDDQHAYIGLNGGSFAGIMINDDNVASRAGMIFDYGSDDLAIFTQGSYRVYFKENGRVGFNDALPSAGVHIKQFGSNEEALAIENDLNTSTWSYEIGTNDLFLYFNGVQKGSWNDADGVYTSVSDERLKTEISGITKGILEDFVKLDAKSYYFKADDHNERKSLGFIAQEVATIFPDVVHKPEMEDGYYTLNYQEIGVLAVQAIKELNQKVSQQEYEIDRMKSELREKDMKLAELENLIKMKFVDLEARINNVE